jgi:hypothetical protein
MTRTYINTVTLRKMVSTSFSRLHCLCILREDLYPEMMGVWKASIAEIALGL